jgi:hypothetical protein
LKPVVRIPEGLMRVRCVSTLSGKIGINGECSVIPRGKCSLSDLHACHLTLSEWQQAKGRHLLYWYCCTQPRPAQRPNLMSLPKVEKIGINEEEEE